MEKEITCNDCLIKWKTSCPYCKTKCKVKIKQTVNKKPIITQKYNVFKNPYKILGKKAICIYCHEPSNTRDHFYPRSKGGVLTVNCCFDCNQQKADLIPSHWLMYLDHAYIGNDKKRSLIKSNTKKLISITYGY